MITEDIIKEAQAGNSHAFETIYNETVKTASYVAKRILLDEDATEDVLQEAYIAVYKNLTEYKTGNLQGWIDTIVANRAKNYLRRKNPIFFSEMETEENPVVEFEEEKIEFRPDEKVDYNETQRLILEIVDSLSPEQRISVMLFYFEEKSVKEIAEICECSENTVKSRLNYARKKIKEDVLELEKKGTKLYSVSIIPFIIWMLSEKAKACEVPKATAAKVLAGVNATANTVANVAANTAGNVAVNAVSSATAKVVAGKVGMTIGAKIAIGIVAATVAVGAVIGGVAIFGNNDDGQATTEVTTTKVAENQTTTEQITTEIVTTEEPTTEELTTEEVTTEEPTTVVYAEWIDTLYSQMVGLDFDSVVATISKEDFTEQCAIYETSRVSGAYENTCYRLPVSTGGQIGIVVMSSEITIFVCSGDGEEHEDHRGGFEYIGYGDIVVQYSEDGVVTCDGIHVKSAKPGQMSFDMEPGGIWIVWSV